MKGYETGDYVVLDESTKPFTLKVATTPKKNYSRLQGEME